MSEKKNKKGRREYLKEFRQDGSGKYSYTGKVTEFCGTREEYAKKLTVLWIVFCLCAAFIVASGCIDSAGFDNCFYVLIPYAVSVFFAGYACFALVGMTVREPVLRDYIYKKSAKVIASRALMSAVSSAVCAVCIAVYTLINGFGGKTVSTICAIFFMASASILMLIFRSIASDIKWNC